MLSQWGHYSMDPLSVHKQWSLLSITLLPFSLSMFIHFLFAQRWGVLWCMGVWATTVYISSGMLTKIFGSIDECRSHQLWMSAWPHEWALTPLELHLKHCHNFLNYCFTTRFFCIFLDRGPFSVLCHHFLWDRRYFLLFLKKSRLSLGHMTTRSCL